MPGYVMHLAVAGQIIKLCGIKDEKFINEFELGNIIPDAVALSDKRQSHFWDDDTWTKFVRKPNLKLFLDKYGGAHSRFREPYVFGYYCHLYFDRRFLEKYWQKHFRFYDDSMREAEGFDEVKKVLLKDNGKIYDRWDFFSDKYYYGDYTLMNSHMLDKYNVKIPEYESVQAEIDEINTIDAKSQLKKLLELIDMNSDVSSKPRLKVFNIEEMDLLIEQTASELAEQYNKGMYTV